jgi:C4-dicarboxylate transporter, DctM subunit
MVAIFLLTTLFAFLLSGFPIGISTGIATALSMIIFTPDIPLQLIAQKAITALESFPLLAIPFFMFAGNLMGSGGISRRLVDLADSLVGTIAGGLALITTLASAFFAAISGSAPATVSAIGSIMIPEMKKRGYKSSFSTAVAACSGTIGVLIPPSIPFVVYSVVARTSIGDMFIAGIIPGLLFTAAIMITGYIISKKRGYVGKEETIAFQKALKESSWALMVPILILGGIYTGIFTPTEAAVAAIFYCIVIGKFIYKELTYRDIFECAKSAATLNGITMYGMGFAMAFGVFLALEMIPQLLLAQVMYATTNKIIILLILNVFFLCLGCFMDNIAATIILTPILLPLVTSIGMSPIQFGILLTVNLAVGFVTPPVGCNLNVASAISKEPIHVIAKEAMPFMLAMIFCLMLVTFVPEVSLALIGIFR